MTPNNSSPDAHTVTCRFVEILDEHGHLHLHLEGMTSDGSPRIAIYDTESREPIVLSAFGGSGAVINLRRSSDQCAIAVGATDAGSGIKCFSPPGATKIALSIGPNDVATLNGHNLGDCDA